LLDAKVDNPGNNGNEDANPEEAGNIDLDADMDGDTNDGVWPGEFVVRL
jgi:hypothetical protein